MYSRHLMDSTIISTWHTKNKTTNVNYGYVVVLHSEWVMQATPNMKAPQLGQIKNQEIHSI